MASIRRQGDVFEIRECEPRGGRPRQRALARFRRVLTADVLERAALAARRPFDRKGLLERARTRGIPICLERSTTGARALIARLRRGDALDPLLVTLLRDELALRQAAPLPEHLADVVDWVGEEEVARGRALRGLLRTASRIARSRAVREVEAGPGFPRFSSGAAFG
ncbi:MAG: hypothetical protein H6748_03150 [Spirochaetaceae bacterium]|nr:hypothetical protein [Myxococcales bacterium]MCB9723025.1 hypothetical protein [Spirochaetaceae bacterium]